MRVLLIGSTGTLGTATARALLAAGCEVVTFGRRAPEVAGVEAVLGDVSGEWPRLRFDAAISCLASRTGAPAEAWAIDNDANVRALEAARAAGASRFVMLSALCVQKPQLAFQFAKLDFEAKLAASGIDYAIVRPTAFFKSLSGQVENVRRGRKFVVFGDGRLTATKPISDADLAAYLVAALTDPARRNCISPIGGPGPAITPRDQAEALSRLLGRPVPVLQMPLGLFKGIVGAMGVAGRLVPALAAKAEFARIGLYYASQSMLVWDETRQRYDADATPETGHDTLFAHYAKLLRGEARADLGPHAMFQRT